MPLAVAKDAEQRFSDIGTTCQVLKRLSPSMASRAARDPGDTFVRQEAIEVLEAKLKAARPTLVADFRRKHRTVVKKKAKAAR